MLTYSYQLIHMNNSLIRNLQKLNQFIGRRNISTSKMSNSKFGMPKRYEGSVKSVWNEYIQLAAEYKPLDLGQGFPDFAPPKHVTDNLAKIANTDNPLLHQYTRGFGHVRLVNILAKFYSQLIGQQINPLTEIIVTAGAYGALYSSIIGHVDVGDEVIIIEPYFDCYEPMVRNAGGIPKFIPLRHKPSENSTGSAADWVLDKDELEALFCEKTKLIILNTPNNPFGKVFELKELEVIAELCKKWNVVCISDEVYEWLVYKPFKHIRIASLPGMWERTITVGSAGKTFSVTGWKGGWAYGPANLMTNLQLVHQNCIYCCNTPIQEALAISFETEVAKYGQDDCYFTSLALELENKRDFLVGVLKEVGMKPIIPNGGYFVLADWSALESKIDLSSETDKYKDYKFTKWMTKNVGLQGIPPTAFYSEPNKPLAEHFVRYCFMKKDEKLQKAAEIFKKWKA